MNTSGAGLSAMAGATWDDSKTPGRKPAVDRGNEHEGGQVARRVAHLRLRPPPAP